MTDPNLLLVKLRWEQARLLKSVEAIEAHVATPQPGSHDQLIALRWAFVRDMLLHFAHFEEQVLQPLMGDARDRAAQVAARSSHDLTNVYRQFQRHAQQWHGPVAASLWCPYREAIGLLMRRVRVRLMAQESEIYPLLPAQPGERRLTPPVPPVDYTGEAIKLRSLVHADRHECEHRLAN